MPPSVRVRFGLSTVLLLLHLPHDLFHSPVYIPLDLVDHHICNFGLGQLIGLMGMFTRGSDVVDGWVDERIM